MRGRRANLKAKIGIATAVAVGGAAIAVAAVAASSQGSPAAMTAGFARSAGSTSQWSMLNSAASDWRSSQQFSYSTLAHMHQQGYTQATQHNKTMAMQRGIVVLVTSKFLILQSNNGSLHLWVLSANTMFKNVVNTTSGATAMMGSTSAAMQATQSSSMIPAANLMAGSALTASNMLSVMKAPQTYTVTVAGTSLTVTVTVVGGMATVSQTATANPFSTPMHSPVTFTQPAWMTAMTATIARGDLALVVGTRSHKVLNAQLVLFVPMTTGDVAGRSAAPNPAPPASQGAFSGTHT